MKPEPLKDKGKELGSAIPKEDRIKYHEDKDIKSAVEWLKEKIKGGTNPDGSNLLISGTLEWIDKAFEDINKTPPPFRNRKK